MKTPTTFATLTFALLLSLQAPAVFGQCASPAGPPAIGLPGVAFGPVHLQHGNLPSGAPVFLDIEDCDADGLLDAFVPWSDMGAAPPATFYTGAACPPVGIKSISISFVGNSGPSTWRAYGPFGLLATQTRPGGGPQVVTLTSTKTHIVRVELQGDEICVKEVCWTCRTRKPWFFRGDFNSDGIRDISDAIAGLNYLFVSGEEPGCLSAADSNDDGELDLSDPTHLLAHLFSGGQEPAGGTECNLDETEDELTCEDSGLCSQDEPTDPTDELAERLSVFIGADIRPQDLQLMPVEELGNREGGPEYVQQALQTEGSSYLLVAGPIVEGFEQAFYEVPPGNREAYLGAQFVMIMSSWEVATELEGDPLIDPIEIEGNPLADSIQDSGKKKKKKKKKPAVYYATRCINGSCILKQFSYPTSDRCKTHADCEETTTGPGTFFSSSQNDVLEYKKCDGGSLVKVTVEKAAFVKLGDIKGNVVSCDSLPTAILEDLGL